MKIRFSTMKFCNSSFVKGLRMEISASRCYFSKKFWATTPLSPRVAFLKQMEACSP